MIDRNDDDSGSGAGSNCANSFSIRYRDILSDDDDDDDDLGMYEDDDDDVMNNDPIREDLLEEVFCADIANIGDADDSSPSSPSSGSGDANSGRRRAGEEDPSSSIEPQKKPWWFRSQMMKEDSGISGSTSESNSNKNSGGDNRNMSGRDEGGVDGGRRGSSTSAGTSSSGPRSGGGSKRMRQRRLSLERDDSLRRKLERRQRLSKVVAGQTGDEPSQLERRMSDLSHREGAGQDHGVADESAGDANSTRGGEGGTTRVVRRLSGIFSGGAGGGEGDGGGYDPLNKQGSSRSDDFAPEDQRRRRELEKELSGLMTASTVGLEESSDDANAWRSLSGRRVKGGRSWSSSRHCGVGLVAATLGMRRERLLVVTLTLIMALIACMGAVSVYQRREARVEPPAPEKVETASSNRAGGLTDDHARDDAFPAVAPRNDPVNEQAMTEQDLISTMKERGPPPKALLSLLSSISGSASLIGDPNSASHRAMQWLLYEDAEEWQRLSWDYDTDGDGPMGSDLRARIEQRFALAAVYFANVATGDGTLRGWMTGEHECDWEGVGCGEFGSDPRAGGVRVVTDLDLSRSGLRGPIPDELRALTRLEHLMLQENDLTGSIPSWISELESLDSLYLSNNMLSGKIPEELALLPSLEELWIEGNSLSGAAPQAMCRRVHILVADCLGSRPRVECTCCSSCFP